MITPLRFSQENLKLKKTYYYNKSNLELPESLKKNEIVEEIKLNKEISIHLIPYQIAVNTISELIKDKQISLDKLDAIEEVLLTFRADVIKQLNLKSCE